MAVIISIVLVDQLTKAWAVNRLTRESCSVPDACIEIIGSLRFRLSFNPGAAFSSFTGGGPVLGVIAFLMTVYLVYLSVTSADAVLRWLFPIVGGGAVGNLWDRVFRADDGFLSGKVVDFIDLQFWPIFNVADMAIVVGVALVALRLFTQPIEPNEPVSPGEGQSSSASDAADSPADISSDSDEPSATP